MKHWSAIPAWVARRRIHDFTLLGLLVRNAIAAICSTSTIDYYEHRASQGYSRRINGPTPTASAPPYPTIAQTRPRIRKNFTTDG
jgi:hypothetical protein